MDCQTIKDSLLFINNNFQGLIGILLGAAIAHYSGTKTQKKQLKHDSIEKDKERKLSTKKELYLEAVEVLSKTSSYLGSLVNANLKDTNVSNGFQDLFISLSKISLISDKETVKVATDLSTEYQKLMFKLTTKLYLLSNIKSSLDIERSLYDKSQKEIDRVIMLMKENNESITGTTERINRLHRTYEIEENNSKEYYNNIKKFNKEHMLEQLVFTKGLIEDTKRLSPLTTNLFYNFRRELEIDTDIQYFNDIFTQQEKIINEDLQKFIDYLENLINEIDKKD